MLWRSRGNIHTGDIEMIMKSALQLVVALMIFTFLPAGQTFAAEVAAMVTDVQGKVARLKASGQPPVSILAELAAGAGLVLDKSAMLKLVYIKSGNEYAFQGPGNVKIASDAPSMTGAGAMVRMPAQLLAQGAKLKVENGRVIQAAIVMRDADSPSQLHPGANQKILENRPIFRWKPVGSNPTANFELLDDEAGTTMMQAQVKGDTYQLPDHVSLIAGRTYYWSVEASDGKGPKQVANFTLATDEERTRFTRMRPQSGAPFSNRLLYAVLLDQAGFYGESKAIWTQLSDERPDLPQLRRMTAR